MVYVYVILCVIFIVMFFQIKVYILVLKLYFKLLNGYVILFLVLEKGFHYLYYLRKYFFIAT